jgi:hypothetical protein
MKFEKLYNLVLEAGFRPSAPKNMGGSRIQRVKDSEGPASFSSSSVGKNDNPENVVPISRWEFNPNVDMDRGGVKKQAKVWRTLFNAFSLLSNDKNFQDEVKSISSRFDKKRDSYKNVIGVSDEEGNKNFVKYDEESRVNTLPATIDKQLSKRTGLEAELKQKYMIRNYTKMPPGEKIKLKTSEASLKGQISVLDKELSDPKMPKYRKEKLTNQLMKLNQQLGNVEDKLSWIDNKDKITVDSDILELQEKIAELDKKIQKNQEELVAVTDRTTKIQSNNEENNDKAIDEFKKQVNVSAGKIKDALAEEIKELQMTEGEGVEDLDNAMEVDWSNIPENFKSKVKMLDDLESTDPSTNPIFGYIDSFNNWYYEFSEDGDKSRVKDLDSREFNPQLNITKIRDYMSLPFVRLMSIYSSASIPKMSLKKEKDLTKHNNVYQNFTEYIKQYPNSRDAGVLEQSRKAWVDPEVKEMLRSFVAGMAIEDKDNLYRMINQPWSVSRSGFNNFNQLKSSVDSDMKRFMPKKESFDKLFNKLISEKVWDDDDFKLDTMEILSYYK